MKATEANLLKFLKNAPQFIIPIFQPHLYSRTKRMAAEFATVLENGADLTIVVPVYAAREMPEPGVTGKLITDLFVNSHNAILVESWAEAIDAAVRVARPGDILLSMGGGDVFGLVPDLLEALKLHSLKISGEHSPTAKNKR